MKRIIRGDKFNQVLDIALEWLEENPQAIVMGLDGYMKHSENGLTLTVIEIEYEEGV